MGFYRFFLSKCVLPVGDFLFDGNYLKTLKQWRKYDNFPEEKLLAIQEEELKKILLYTIKNVSFYQNIKYLETENPYQNLKNFPILTKDILRKERENLVSKEFEVNTLRKNFSSGSSGISRTTVIILAVVIPVGTLCNYIII